MQNAKVLLKKQYHVEIPLIPRKIFPIFVKRIQENKK